jgi:hypothetical protein
MHSWLSSTDLVLPSHREYTKKGKKQTIILQSGSVVPWRKGKYKKVAFSIRQLSQNPV